MRYIWSSILVLAFIAASHFEWNSAIMYGINGVLVMTIGLLHGSNDLIIYKKITGTKWKVLGLYYAIVTSIFLILYFIGPLWCLCAFVLVSAFHFGEEMNELDDFEDSIIHFLLTGLVVFLMMFYLNHDEFNRVIFDLSGEQFSRGIMFISLIISLITYISYGIFDVLVNKVDKMSYLSQFIGLAFLAVAFFLSDLFTSFTLFFVFWHSLPSVRNQISHIYKKNDHWNQYIRDALPIFLISIIGVVLGFYFFHDQDMFSTFALFAGIIVTVPHIIIIYRLYKTGKVT